MASAACWASPSAADAALRHGDLQDPLDLAQDPLLGIQLAQDRVRAQLLGHVEDVDVVEGPAAGNGDDPRAVIDLLQRADHLAAVHPRHEDVGDDEVRMPQAVDLEGLLAVAAFDDLMPPVLQDAARHAAIEAVVVNDQNRSHIRSPRWPVPGLALVLWRQAARPRRSKDGPGHPIPWRRNSAADASTSLMRPSSCDSSCLMVPQSPWCPAASSRAQVSPSCCAPTRKDEPLSLWLAIFTRSEIVLSTAARISAIPDRAEGTKSSTTSRAISGSSPTMARKTSGSIPCFMSARIPEFGGCRSPAGENNEQRQPFRMAASS